MMKQNQLSKLLSIITLLTCLPLMASVPATDVNQTQQPFYGILAKEKCANFKLLADVIAEYKRNNLTISKKAACFDRYGFCEVEELNEDDLYNSLVKKYAELDSQIKTIQEKPQGAIFGGIHYGMTLNEMKQTIKDKFHWLKETGKIISAEEFEKIKEDYFVARPRDVTRIWCADYFKTKINEAGLNNKYDVPNYIIVHQGNEPMTVKINFATDAYWPSVYFLDNATIYFAKVNGKCVTKDPEVIRDLAALGYDDFSGNGNILRETATGKTYLVDVERSAMNMSMVLPKNLRALLIYAWQKFAHEHLEDAGYKKRYLQSPTVTL